MGRKCSAPNCRSGFGTSTEEDVPVHKYPRDPLLREKWFKAVPRQIQTITNNSGICKRHFTSSDYKNEKADSNDRRLSKCPKTLKYNLLKPSAVPSVWPNCPKFLTKSRPVIRSGAALSASRRQKEAFRIEDANQKFIESDLISPLEGKCFDISD